MSLAYAVITALRRLKRQTQPTKIRTPGGIDAGADSTSVCRPVARRPVAPDECVAVIAV